jgi:talin
LEYYLLKSGDEVDYCNKCRKLKLRLLDGESRTLLVDDSQPVGQLMIYICSQIGIANYEEYSLIYDMPIAEKEKTLTLKRQHDKSLSRDFKKMEELKKKLHTEDDSEFFLDVRQNEDLSGLPRTFTIFSGSYVR